MAKFKYKIVVFDFDDTLVESRIAKWSQHKHVAKKFYNIDLTEEELLKHWGKPFDLLISELYQHSDTLEKMHEAIFSTKGDFPKKVFKKSVSTINKLLENNIKVGVLSAMNKNFIGEDLINFGFPAKNFSIIQGADETKVHKPNPGVFIPLLKNLKKDGIKKEEIVYVGDSIDDFYAASKAGIDFIAVTTGLYSYSDFKKGGAKVIVKEIQDILKEVIG